MNILTFDIEEWSIEKEFRGGCRERYVEFDQMLDCILKLLSVRGIKATFFCLGKIALDFPEVIKKIDAGGHEIGSHSHAHKWINKMTPDEFREDTRRVVFAIEDLIGKKVKSFRAPAFSVGESNKWAFEILAEYGIENDASIFPGARDFGGFPDFTEQQPCIVEYNGLCINEFPIPLCNLPLLNKRIAYSGGGYFRLLPFEFVKKQMNKSTYNMCYFHIKDLLTERQKLLSKAEYEDYFKEPGTFKNRYLRYFKTSVGRRNALKNLEKLLDSFMFLSVEEYCQQKSLEKIIKI